MLRIPDLPLPEPAAEKLLKYQREIDAVADYPQRVSVAKHQFKSRNRPANPTFRAVREMLKQMCGGVRRCMYCEDSMAAEVEHIKPKSLYPEAVFVWINMLYACGICNRSKGNRYFVDRTSDGKIVDVARSPGAEVSAPPAGDPILIDPRQDDPLDLLALDLQGTFRFVPRAQHGSREHTRAVRTLDVLKLNGRDDLAESRRVVFESLLALLEQYIKMRREDASSDRLSGIRTAIIRQPHPTVWFEMKRQRQSLVAITGLFESAPEALAWSTGAG